MIWSKLTSFWFKRREKYYLDNGLMTEITWFTSKLFLITRTLSCKCTHSKTACYMKNTSLHWIMNWITVLSSSTRSKSKIILNLISLLTWKDIKVEVSLGNTDKHPPFVCSVTLHIDATELENSTKLIIFSDFDSDCGVS